MTFNLFIAYDLIPPGQNYRAVHQAIMALGQWHQFQQSFWYVNTSLSPEEAFYRVISVMDSRDKLAVINAESGMVTNWDQPPVEAINAIWSSQS
ncbi:hypothetical protein KHC17_18720 [Agrobacterium salinitolerans]|uniref:hypothetical protein n=1 Tax=Agrobacterium salinitolerans TaxID=1183413 RepID=UPI001C22F82B|nr:hypothetical protein [Agrobacterium salinitolerans]QXC49886.1 hypothetical protein KHC17_18720 [Agrobacterium salinitolerans]